jgi:hypothetical protein
MIFRIEKIYCKPGIIYSLHIIFTFFIASCTGKDKPSATLIKKLPTYPSASAIDFINGKLYVMGDDAPGLLILDTHLNILDSIPLISYAGRRIPREIKPDLEAAAYSATDTGTTLFLFGSGSLFPHRHFALKYYFGTKKVDSIPLQSFFSQLKNSGIEQVNIEGACIVAGSLFLSNRGNKSYPYNHLIAAQNLLWNEDDSFHISITPIQLLQDTAAFSGVSGLCYAEFSDKLIMCVSTEDTRSSHEDGAIGKSYLWIIDNASKKLKNTTISPDRVIDLEKTDSRFAGQKIESAAVIRETGDEIHLALVADNDDGSSTVFKIGIKK